METAVRFSEQPEILELITVLQNNGMKKEQQEITAMAHYLENLGLQYGEVLNELKEVRGQLSAIQNKGIKAAALRVVDKVEGKIAEMKNQVIATKNGFVELTANAAKTFRQQGTLALRKAMEEMGIPWMLHRLKDSVHKAAEAARQGVVVLVAVSRELHTAHEHTAPQNSDKGILNRFQAVLEKAHSAFTGLEQRIGGLLDKVQGKKHSVRVSLREVRPQQKGVRVPVKRLEQTR